MTKRKTIKSTQQQPSINKAESAYSKQFSQAKDWIEKHPSWTYFGIGIMLVLFLFKNYLFGGWLYLFDDIGSDTLNVYYPQLAHISDYIRQEGIPGWSFSQGLGQNMFPNSLTDLFYLPLYLMGNHHLVYGIAWMEVVKVLLAGWLFLRYLHLMDVRGIAAVTGALLFSFSGFAILGSGWYIFTAHLVHTALLLLGFELFFQKNKPWLFIGAVTLAALQISFNLFMYGAFFAIYFLFRFFSQKNQTAKDFLRQGLGLGFAGLLGACIAAINVIPSLIEILNSPRGGALSLSDVLLSEPMFGTEKSHFYGTIIYRMFSNDMAGSALDFTGWDNYLEASIGYCGWVSLILAPQVFWVLTKREKLAFGCIIGLFVMIHVFPWLRYAFWGFSGIYFRTLSLFTSIVLLLCTTKVLQALSDGKKIPLWSIMLSTVVWLVLLYMSYGAGPNGPLKANIGLQLAATAFLAGYTFLFLAGSFYSRKSFLLLAILALVTVELTISNYGTLHNRRPVTKKAWETKGRNNYNDYSAEAVDYVKSIDKGFYRINKTFQSGASGSSPSLNDAKIFSYNGLTSYSSFNNKNFINLLIGSGIIDTVPDIRYSNIDRIRMVEFNTRWAAGINRSPYLQCLTSTKYLLQRLPLDAYTAYSTDLLTTIGDSVKVFRWKPYLPFGFTYDSYVVDKEIKKIQDPFNKQIAMLKAAVVPDSMVSQLAGFSVLQAEQVPTAANYNADQVLSDVNLLKVDTLSLTHFGQNHFSGTISLSRAKLLCLSIPLDVGWKIMLDGKQVKPFAMHYGLMGLLIQPGEHALEMTYHVPYLGLSIGISMGALAILLILLLMNFLRNRKISAPNPVAPKIIA